MVKLGYMRQSKRRWHPAILFFLLAIIQCTPSPKKLGGDVVVSDPTLVDTIPAPVKIQQLQGLGNDNQVYFIDGESVLRPLEINGKTGIKVSGDVFFCINQGELPITMQTSLVTIQILEIPARFRIDGYDKDEGQAIEVLEGTLRIAKAYSSPFPEPDTLHANNLYMINKSIDLSEKETMDNDELQKWWEKYKTKG